MNQYVCDLPNFSAIHYNNVEQQLSELLAFNLKKIDELLTQQNFTWENLMQPLDELEDKLNKFWGPITHLHSVKDSQALRDVYNACLSKLSDYSTTISHNQKLYTAIEQLKQSPEWKTFNAAQKTIIDNNLRDFKLAGVALPKAKQETFAKLSKKLSKLNTKFEENLLDATHAWKKHITDEAEIAGLTEHAKAIAQHRAEENQLPGWLLTLDPPSYIAVMTHADNRQLREETYCAYNTRASDQGPHAGQWDNGPVMVDILNTRQAIAKLLEFNHYAERSLATKMDKTPEEVHNFLKHLVQASLPKARAEFNVLKKYAKEKLNITRLEAWDIAYASEKLRTTQHAISQEELRPYFPEHTVLQGLFLIVNKLYGVTVKPLTEVDTWHSDVKVFAMYDENKHLISKFYLDLYARPAKRGGAWMDECLVRRCLDSGKIQVPVAYIVCNFNEPTQDKPALFTHNEVETLFHEFGHALQHMLTQVNYLEVSGINGIPWDAVEVASQFMEHYAWEREGMDLIAKHYQTQQSMPQALYQRMVAAKHFQTGMAMVRQLEFALFDFKLHLVQHIESANQIQDILNAVRKQVTVIPVPEFNRFQHGFAHIFSGGYAAGYYSYKWAEVMACDAFSLFKENGIFDQATAKKFRDTLLASGGAINPAQLFKEFCGHEPRVDALLEQTGIKKRG